MKIKELLKDKSIVGSAKLHYLKLVVFMFVMWILLSGRFEVKFILYGIATALICGWLCMPLLLVDSTDGKKKYFIFDFPIFGFLRYSVWLLWQLILANIDVAKAIVSPEMQIDPKVLRFKTNFDNPMALTVLANSITLTPGTVTMNVTEDGVYEIHALTHGAAEGLLGGDMQQRVAKLFKQDTDIRVYTEDDMI